MSREMCDANAIVSACIAAAALFCRGSMTPYLIVQTLAAVHPATTAATEPVFSDTPTALTIDKCIIASHSNGRLFHRVMSCRCACKMPCASPKQVPFAGGPNFRTPDVPREKTRLPAHSCHSLYSTYVPKSTPTYFPVILLYPSLIIFTSYYPPSATPSPTHTPYTASPPSSAPQDTPSPACDYSSCAGTHSHPPPSVP